MKKHVSTLFRVAAMTGVVFGLTVGAQAQARKASGGGTGGGSGAGAAATLTKDSIKIKKVDGLGATARVKTPDYQVNSGEGNASSRDWARVTVSYKTELEWIDELEFRYFVLVKNPKTEGRLIFTGTFTYVDIAKGNQHQSTVFLRPQTLERYGDIEGAAVEIYARGELILSDSNLETPKGWWRTATSVRTVEGVLLERSQTPWAFVAWDNYESVKGK